ncbi:hypothetical protein F5X97DRAFT_336658 [Nemania serpens]|nr:hypothetical protein F5X97DRAFT_336658 [Nemania serpens]
MSGLEIAGLVLGALPLAVKAVQGYRETLYSIKNVKRDLDYMERNIETEQRRLENTCEELLVGIVPRAKIRSMIKDPFGPDWKDYADKLIYSKSRGNIFIFCRRLRLYTSYDIFEECITHMSEATQNLQLQLDRASILEAFRQNASFTLKRKEYETILKELRAGNDALEHLHRTDRDLEPSRYRRSQSRVVDLLRRLSQSIYNALCGAITCSCIYSHSIGLQLAQREAVILPGDIEEKTVLNLHQNKEPQPMYHWKNFELRLMEYNKLPPNQASKISSPTSPSLKPRVSDLCEVVGRGGKTTAVKCYGYILDTERKFVLSPMNDETDTHIHITLRQAIEGDILGLPPFGYEERLRVALALSVGVLNLHGTTWLGQIVTLDNIVFMIKNEDTMDQPAYALYQPFLIKDTPHTHAHRTTTVRKSPATRAPGSGREINDALLALATLLIQIMVGRIDDELSMTGIMDSNSIISRQEKGISMEGEIVVNGGMNYAAAVTWCLGSVYKVADLQNDEFCQKFHEAVIRRFEDDLEVITNS